MLQILTRVSAMIGVLSVALTATLRAQHTHTAPHGGEVIEVAEHHVEFKADSTGSISVWLLDEQQQVLPAPSGASITLMGAGGSQVTIPLQADTASQRLVARFDPRTFATFRAVVSLPITGTRHNLRFRYP